MKIFVLLSVIHYGLIVPISIWLMIKESQKSWKDIIQRMSEENK